MGGGGGGGGPSPSAPPSAQLAPRVHAPAPLRRLRLPEVLVQHFLAASSANTAVPPRGVETCGVLAGRIRDDGAIDVTHLVLPAQSGGPDSCEMTRDGEDALLDFCLSSGLLTLGWIHSHPSQTCFMSALDLHTHVGYQSSLPEAVAVVVAPHDPSTGGVSFAAFRLTDATTDPRELATPQREPWSDPGARAPLFAGSLRGVHGLGVVQACPLKGFHRHPEAANITIYEVAKAHAALHPMPLEVVDMRSAGPPRGGEWLAPPTRGGAYAPLAPAAATGAAYASLAPAAMPGAASLTPTAYPLSISGHGAAIGGYPRL
jgi:proteasome lid subunit RPN8/RPN11